ncbi:MAG: helix-turn-helix domain-containing protein [Lachnospiraceae bacterium]|nr:helix-turn-helix domain-containing protein [Lachnospiraceae bacterium]
MISYRPLWKTLEQKNISQYYLLKNGIDNRTLDSLKKNKNITLVTLEKLCNIIGCLPNDIVEFK